MQRDSTRSLWKATRKACPKVIYVVYDIEAYRFQSIFRIFSSRPVEWVAMGTFLPEERIIITTEEVLK